MMKRQTLFFSVAAGLLPLAALVLLEVLLLVFNLFPQTPLFEEQIRDDRKVTAVNSRIGERYFNKKTIPVPNLYPQTFSTEKPEGTFRIFCLGGSTTAGFPYEMTVPFPRQLQFLLENEHANRKFEVINLGLSAINSFTVLDWLPEILKQQPDLVLIYMGHNEFYGAYGTGSTISFGHQGWLVRTILKIRKLRLVQMLNTAVSALTPKSDVMEDATVMEKMINDRFIAADSRLREVTHTNYERNLELILGLCTAKNIPVVVSNLVSNLADQPPLDSSRQPDSSITEALKFYRQGLSAISSMDSVQAFEAFRTACDRDAVPFRAGSRLNAIISETARKFDVPMVDMDRAFRANSRFSIPGKNLFCDHLHPNPIGYRIMANEFRKVLAAEKILPGNEHDRWNGIRPLMVTELDWEIGAVRIFKLKHHWPFENKPVDYDSYPPLVNLETAGIAKEYLFSHHVWGRAHAEMASVHLQNNAPEKACAEYQAILTEYPDKTEYYPMLIDCARSIGAWTLVEHTCYRALNWVEEKGMIHYHLAVAQRMTGRIQQALATVQIAMKSPSLSREQATGIYFLYASLLVDTREFDTARRILEDIQNREPDYEPARLLLEQISN